MTHNEALMATKDAYIAGVHPRMIMMALLNDGISKERAETILRWCIVLVEREKQALDIHA